jgi:hypothetical protein
VRGNNRLGREEELGDGEVEARSSTRVGGDLGDALDGDAVKSGRRWYLRGVRRQSTTRAPPEISRTSQKRSGRTVASPGRLPCARHGGTPEQRPAGDVLDNDDEEEHG